MQVIARASLVVASACSSNSRFVPRLLVLFLVCLFGQGVDHLGQYKSIRNHCADYEFRSADYGLGMAIVGCTILRIVALWILLRAVASYVRPDLKT